MIDRKMCNNYCFILLDRIKKCEDLYPDCEELKKTIHNVYEDFAMLKTHGIEDWYVAELHALFAKYLDVMVDMVVEE